MVSITPIHQQNLTQGETENFTSFKIIKNEYGCLLTLFELFTQSTLNELALRVKGRLKQLPNNPPWRYPVPYEKVLNLQAEEILTAYKNPKADDELVQAIKAKCGLEMDEQKAGMEKVLSYIKEFFKRLPQEINPQNVNTIVATWQEASMLEKVKMRTMLCGSRILQERVKLSTSDQEFIGLSAGPEAEKMDCATYALMKQHESQAIKWIQSGTAPKDFYDKNPMKYFIKWGYGTVKAINVKPNDLVVYLDHKQETGYFITHLGFMTESGLLESKMGFDEPGVSLHKLEDIPAQFGNHVAFLRKKPSSA